MCSDFLYAQVERNTWYFGALAGMQFNEGAYTSLSDNTITRSIVFGQIEGPDNIICASDEEGNLMFYSDGRVFKNRLNQNMLNSPTNKYALRESQTAIARHPSDEEKYYVFVIIQEGTKSILTYNIVDMSLDDGLGGLDPNVNHKVVVSGVGQHLVVARHANGKDSWLICLRNGKYLAYLISENGISNSAVTSTEGLSLFDGNAANFGVMEISPDNSLIAAGFPALRKLFLLEFNDLNGQLDLIFEEEEEDQDISLGPYTGIEFSSNSRVLYTTYLTTGIQQYDLSDLDNIPERVAITTDTSIYPYLKRGPDGKIISIERGRGYVGAIQDPNVIGPGCNYNPNILSLSGSTLMDLPTFLLPKFPEGISYINICQGEATEFYYKLPYGAPTYQWDFGDGTTSTGGDTVTHTYAEPGTYTVSIDVYNGFTNNYLYTETKEITIYATPTIPELNDVYLCSAENPIFFMEYDDLVLADQSNDIFRASYYYSEQDALLKDNEITEIIPEVGTKTVWVRLENTVSPSCFDISSFDVVTPEFITLDIDNDQFLCPKQRLTLNAPDGFINYRWSTGETTQDITVNSTGKYTLTVVKDLGDYTCEVNTIISVRSPGETPEIKEIKVTDWSLDQNSIEIITSNPGNFEYSIDGVNYQNSPIFNDLPIDEYIAYVREKECYQETRSNPIYMIGYNKFFTPNSDGFNDYWQVKNSNNDEEIEVIIMDRYGKLIARFGENDRGWDGTNNGVPMPTSDYWFRVIRSSGEEHFGHFTLKR